MKPDSGSIESSRTSAIMNFIVWGLGDLYVERRRIYILNILLHLYLYFLIIATWLFPLLLAFAILMLPIFVLLGSLSFSLTISRKKMDLVKSEVAVQPITRAEVVQPSKESRKFCINCGIGIPVSARYCSACGSIQE